MGLYANLEPVLQDIIQRHGIKIINKTSSFRHDADSVFYFLQVSLDKEGLKQASQNLMFDRRFKDADGHCNAAGFAVATYIKERSERPDVDYDDGFIPPDEESTCSIM